MKVSSLVLHVVGFAVLAKLATLPIVINTLFGHLLLSNEAPLDRLHSNTQFKITHLNPVLPEEHSPALYDYLERFGTEIGWGLYSSEGLTNGIGEGVKKSEFPNNECPYYLATSYNKELCILYERHDQYHWFTSTGGRRGLKKDGKTLVSQADYFRETWSYGGVRQLDDPILDILANNPKFEEGARKAYNLSLDTSGDEDVGSVVPYILFSNLLIPGQELAVHTDVPEFRGANRKTIPQWLIVSMHHSQLFKRWRLKIATGVSWWTDTPKSGVDQKGFTPMGFAYYPDGPHKESDVIAVSKNTGIVLDTDSFVHGVDMQSDGSSDFPDLRAGMKMKRDAETDVWYLHHEDGSRIRPFDPKNFRLSISWKAYVFNNAEERRLWEDHSDDLDLETILRILKQDMLDNDNLPERFRGDNLSAQDTLDFGLHIMHTYISLPKPEDDYEFNYCMILDMIGSDKLTETLHSYNFCN